MKNNDIFILDERNAALATLFILLLISPIVPAYVSFVLVFCAWSVLTILFKWTIAKVYLNVALPFLILLALGAFGFMNHQFYDACKDAWYVLKPMMIIGLGFKLGSMIKKENDFLIVVVIAASILAFIHIIFVSNHILLGMSLWEIRDLGVRGYLLVIIALAFLLYYHSEFHDRLGFVLYVFLLTLFTLSLMLSFSRLLIICFLVITVCLFGLMRIRMQSIFFFAILLTVILVFFSGSFNDILLIKFLNIFNEISIADYSSLQDINIHWRGYETHMALQAFYAGTWQEQWFGQGFGAMANLGLDIMLGDHSFREIQIFHNGYVYILLKCGISGLILYMFFLALLIFRKNHESFFDRLVSAMGWCLLFSSWVAAGAFNKSSMDSVLLIAGVAWGMLLYAPFSSKEF